MTALVLLDPVRRWPAPASLLAGLVLGFVLIAICIRDRGPKDPDRGCWIEDPETGERIYTSDPMEVER